QATHSHFSARVPVGLRASAHAHPQRMFDVIVQSSRSATSADAAQAVKSSARSRVVKRQYSSLRSVSASLTGAGLLRLAQRPDVYAVTPNTPVTMSTNNPQKWVGGPHIDWYWGSPNAKTKAATIAIVDSGIDNSSNQFGTRLLTQVDFTPAGSSSRADGRGHGTFVAGLAASQGKYGGAAP